MPRRRRIGLGRAAAVGAAAGLAGGAAMLVVRAIEEGAVAGGRDARRRAVAELRRRSTAAHLAYAAAIGAVYGVVSSRLRLPAATEGALLSGFGLIGDFADPVPSLRSADPSPAQRALRLVLPAGAQSVYGYTTAAVFRALAR